MLNKVRRPALPNSNSGGRICVVLVWVLCVCTQVYVVVRNAMLYGWGQCSLLNRCERLRRKGICECKCRTLNWREIRRGGQTSNCLGCSDDEIDDDELNEPTNICCCMLKRYEVRVYELSPSQLHQLFSTAHLPSQPLSGEARGVCPCVPVDNRSIPTTTPTIANQPRPPTVTTTTKMPTTVSSVGW